MAEAPMPGAASAMIRIKAESPEVFRSARDDQPNPLPYKAWAGFSGIALIINSGRSI
jgi:hypothetical protein